MFYGDIKNAVAFCKKNPQDPKSSKTTQILQGSKMAFFSKCQFLTLYTSILGQTELSRLLHSDFGFSEDEIDHLWGGLCGISKLKILKKITVDDEVDKMAKRANFGKGGVINCIHLCVAKEHGLWFVTGDELFEKKPFKDAYDKSLSYTQFRKMISKECDSKCELTSNCSKFR